MGRTIPYSMEIKFMFQIPNHQPGTVLLTYHKPDIQQLRKWLPLSFLAAGETAQIPTGRSILPGPTANWRFVKKMDDSSYATSFSKPPGSEEPHNSSCETSPFYCVAINHLGTSSGKKNYIGLNVQKQAICG